MMNYCPNCGYHLTNGYVFPNHNMKWPYYPKPMEVWLTSGSMPKQFTDTKDTSNGKKTNPGN